MEIGLTRSEPQRLLELPVRWSGLLAGALVIVALSTFLFLVGTGVVLLVSPPTRAGEASLALLLVLALSTLVGAAVGGWYAGRFSSPLAPRGGLQGFLAWCLAFLFSLAVMSLELGAVLRALEAAALTTPNAAPPPTSTTMLGTGMSYVGLSLLVYWGIWGLSLLLAVLFGGAASRRMAARLEHERAVSLMTSTTTPEPPVPPPPTPPLRPRESF